MVFLCSRLPKKSDGLGFDPSPTFIIEPPPCWVSSIRSTYYKCLPGFCHLPMPFSLCGKSVVCLLSAKRKAPKPSSVLNFGALFWWPVRESNCLFFVSTVYFVLLGDIYYFWDLHFIPLNQTSVVQKCGIVPLLVRIYERRIFYFEAFYLIKWITIFS